MGGIDFGDPVDPVGHNASLVSPFGSDSRSDKSSDTHTQAGGFGATDTQGKRADVVIVVTRHIARDAKHAFLLRTLPFGRREPEGIAISGMIDQLPTELVAAILVHLPAQDILKFSCVRLNPCRSILVLTSYTRQAVVTTNWLKIPTSSNTSLNSTLRATLMAIRTLLSHRNLICSKLTKESGATCISVHGKSITRIHIRLER